MKLAQYFIITEKTGVGRWTLIFLTRFVASSFLLYLLYLWVGNYYARWIAYGAKPVLAIFGYDIIIKKAMSITEDISLNPVVFFSLVIAIMNIKLRKRVSAAILGFLILSAANILTVFMAFLSFYKESETLWAGTEFFNLTINFFLPIFLWFILLPLGSVLPLNRSPRK
ncbi:hypothetical protein J7M07_01140 [bacterium]|nr:hypothetical protein [bacterium]